MSLMREPLFPSHFATATAARGLFNWSGPSSARHTKALYAPANARGGGAPEILKCISEENGLV